MAVDLDAAAATGRSYPAAPAEQRVEELERENAALRGRVLRLETVLSMARMVMAQGCEGFLTVSTPRYGDPDGA